MYAWGGGACMPGGVHAQVFVLGGVHAWGMCVPRGACVPGGVHASGMLCIPP